LIKNVTKWAFWCVSR